jgi:heat shock protein HslJ
MKMKMAVAIALLLAGGVLAQAGLTGITWTLTTLNGTSVEAGKYTIKFNGNGEASGAVDCNSCGWSYTASGQNITITPGMCTMMACLGPTRDFEYMEALGLAATYAVSGARLFLMKNADTLAAFLDPAGGARVPLAGAWRLDKLNKSAANIAGYTLTFTSDSTCGSHMQCNSCQYRYDATLKTISFSRGMCTLVACQGSSREGEYTTAIGAVTKWAIAGDKLYLMNSSDTLLEYSLVASSLAGKLWFLQSIRQASGRTTITTPENYTANFGVNGNVAVKADCNTCSGPYTENAAAATVVITGLGCTKMMCGAGSKDALYTSILTSVQKYAIKGDTLFCYAGADTLVFSTSFTGVIKGGIAPALARKGFDVVIREGTVTVQSGSGAIVEAGIIDLRGSGVTQVSQPAQKSVCIRASGIPAGTYLLHLKTSAGSSVCRLINLVK